ncbi:MAG: hypothetical protein J5I93_08695 [Pirellulaceae bacterium]|nr:hypothetical protein [Pirellulaceae bacterium]
MKLGCFLALLLYAGLVYGYFAWLGQTFDGRALWIASFVVGLIGGMLTLAVVNLGVWGAQEVYRRSDSAQNLWRQQLEQAVRDGDAGTIDRLCQRGAELLRKAGAGAK